MFNENILGVTIDVETYEMLLRCKRECEKCLDIATKLVSKNPDGENAERAKNTVRHLQYVLGLKESFSDKDYDMSKGRVFVSSTWYKDEFVDK